MNNYIAMLRTQAEAVMVRVYGMQEKNRQAEINNGDTFYNEDSFLQCQQELECIAYQINQRR